MYSRKFITVKCVIPKGTKYYRDDIYGEYVSLKLKVIEIVNKNECEYIQNTIYFKYIGYKEFYFDI